MQAGEFSDEDFFRVVAESGARALLIGRRALILLGAPVMTSDYDLWLHFDDAEKLNAAFAAVDHYPNRTPDEARRTGRYVIENGERVDVMLARSAPSPSGPALEFDAAWSHRQEIPVSKTISISLPSIDDLITTKKWGSRARDLLDIQFLEGLRTAKGTAP